VRRVAGSGRRQRWRSCTGPTSRNKAVRAASAFSAFEAPALAVVASGATGLAVAVTLRLLACGRLHKIQPWPAVALVAFGWRASPAGVVAALLLISLLVNLYTVVFAWLSELRGRVSRLLTLKAPRSEGQSGNPAARRASAAETGGKGHAQGGRNLGCPALGAKESGAPQRR